MKVWIFVWKWKCWYLFERESVNICVKVKGDITHLVVTGTVLRYKLSRIVFWRSWSTPPLGNRVFRYWRRSDVIEPERVNGQSVKVQLSFSNFFFLSKSILVDKFWRVECREVDKYYISDTFPMFCLVSCTDSNEYQ